MLRSAIAPKPGAKASPVRHELALPLGGGASGSRRWWALGWLLPLALQLAHVAVVAPAYHVGSFDDDANYLMAAHVLAGGGGLTSTMPSGLTVVADYLPGYPLLLVPLVWAWGAALWPPRILSTVCVAALYPLLWAWMGRRGVRPGYRVAVLGLLAINLVLATYATMVMAEAPFLVVLVAALFAIDGWRRRPGWGRGALVVVLMALLVWLKEAGTGLVVGLVLYEIWRRRWRRAAGVGGGVLALLLPGLAARWLTGGATVGDRYAGEIANPGQGEFVHQVVPEIYHGLWSYLHQVLRQSVLPSGSPLPGTGPVPDLVALVGVSVPVFCVVGAVVWYRRHPRAETWMVGAYFLETLAYPYTNQRRLVLVLPVLTLWYVVGAVASGRAVAGVLGRERLSRALGGRALDRRGLGGHGLSGRGLSGAVTSAAVVVGALAVTVPTASGFTRDYLFAQGQQSSQFSANPAVSLLRSLRPVSAVVETDYRGSIGYFTGHRTAWTAFIETTPYGPFAAQHAGPCRAGLVRRALVSDRASFLVVGDFNIPGHLDSPCLMKIASSVGAAPPVGAVRLLSTGHDHSSVFELLGPGTSQPSLVDRTAGPPASPARQVRLAPDGQGDRGSSGWVAPARGGRASFRWAWRTAEPLSQVSVGSVAPARGSAARVTGTKVAIELPNGTWHTVAGAAGPIGDHGRAPYLLAVLPAGTRALALRITARCSGAAEVSYVDAIGPSS
ncbi:MAG: hypothetical protein ACRDZX_09265 [Acidimicrobiales bacterium]